MDPGKVSTQVLMTQRTLEFQGVFFRAFESILQGNFGRPPSFHEAIVRAVCSSEAFAQIEVVPRNWDLLWPLQWRLQGSWQHENQSGTPAPGEAEMTLGGLLDVTAGLCKVMWSHMQAGFLAFDGREHDDHGELVRRVEAFITHRNLDLLPWTFQDDPRRLRGEVKGEWLEKALASNLRVSPEEITDLHKPLRPARWLLDRWCGDRSPRDPSTFALLVRFTWELADLLHPGTDRALRNMVAPGDLDGAASACSLVASATLTVIETLIAGRIGAVRYALAAERAEAELQEKVQPSSGGHDPLLAFRARRAAILGVLDR